MYDFIEVAKMSKFMLTLFAPIFTSFVVYKTVCFSIDFLKKASHD